MVAWHGGFKVDLISSNFNITNLLIYVDDAIHFLLSLIYCLNKWFEKSSFWRIVDQTLANLNRPWAALGDFNAILSSAEKRGGHCFSSSSSNGLRNLMASRGLVD